MYQSEIDSEINAYEQLLAQTDYKSHKHADGALTDEEWEPIRAQRQTWRDEIDRLRSLEPDPEPDPEPTMEEVEESATVAELSD